MRAVCAAIVALAPACTGLYPYYRPPPPLQAYPGPARPRAELALVRGYDERGVVHLGSDRYVTLEEIRGETVRGSVSTAYVTPGPLELVVMLCEDKVGAEDQYLRKLEFDAEAGHEYAIDYRRSRHAPPFAFRVTDRESGAVVADCEPTLDSCLAHVPQLERAGWSRRILCGGARGPRHAGPSRCRPVLGRGWLDVPLPEDTRHIAVGACARCVQPRRTRHPRRRPGD